jgi:hypothetical protein
MATSTTKRWLMAAATAGLMAGCIQDSGGDEGPTPEAQPDAIGDTQGDGADTTEPDPPAAAPAASAPEELAPVEPPEARPPAPAPRRAAPEAPNLAWVQCASGPIESFPPTGWRVEITDGNQALIEFGPIHAYRDSAFEMGTVAVRAEPDLSRAPFEGRIEPEGVFGQTLDLDIAAHAEAIPGIFEGTLTTTEHGTLPLTCWARNVELPYRYDASTGRCTDPAGQTGHNGVGVPFVRETGDAECMDLRGVELNEGDFGYPILAGWDLRGADLDGAALHFAMLDDVDLRGTDMAGLEYGYAQIDGVIDTHTRLPVAGCEQAEDKISCLR